MKERELISYSFDKIKQYFYSNKDDVEIIGSIEFELSFRVKNRKAKAFRIIVQNQLTYLKNPITFYHQVNGEQSQYTPNITTDINVPQKWDTKQKAVIESGDINYSVIEAGPGSGKTAVACKRVAYLIEEYDLEASKILLISFTRAAVKELRDRIKAFAQNPDNVVGLQICTLDSFTWQIVNGLTDSDPAELLGSYENNISNFICQLRDKDQHLLDYLDEFEHVVLDEGQDLVGERAELALELLRNLNEDCGVTIFADSAQAIYGFTNEAAKDKLESGFLEDSFTVIDRINTGDLHRFKKNTLVNVHRTSDGKLKELFTTGREKLIGKKEGDIESWKLMKKFISECAHGEIDTITKQDLKDKNDHLVLYRTRAEVLMASAFLWDENTPHKLRMSGVQPRILPWIGQLFSSYTEPTINKTEFELLWEEKIAKSEPNFDFELDKAWQLLISQVGDKQNCVRLVRLRELLIRERPPVDFLIDESEISGPVIGTIHASKGREANQVHLMLPPDNFFEPSDSKYELTPREFSEEERVLFVGATRAKEILKIGKGTKLYASKFESRRTYRKPRKYKDARLIEVGLKGDVDFTSLGDDRLHIDHEELQTWLWNNSMSSVKLTSQYNKDLKANILLIEGHQTLPLAILSKQFSKDIWGIAKQISTDKSKLIPSSEIRNIRMVGATTVVIPESEREQLRSPWCHSGFILAPIITGFPMVFFNGTKKE